MKKTLVFTTFVQHQGRKSSKNTAIYTVFSECVENTAFCDVFSTRGFKCTANTMVFFIFFTSSSQSKPTKNTGIYSVLTRQHAKKNNVFKQFSTNFQLVRLHKKRSFFTPFLPPFIRTQEGAKSGQIAKLNLTSTFCLSQSLPQSCSPKNWGRLSGPQNAVNYGVL